jgi:hypothetical protein
MRENEVVPWLRARVTAQRAKEQRIMQDAVRYQGNPAAKLAESRAAAYAEASDAVAAALLEVAQRKSTRATNMEPARFVDALRTHGARSDFERLKALPVSELVRIASSSSDPVAVDDVLQVIARRIEQGAADLEGTALQLARLRADAVAAHPEVARWRAEHEELTRIERHAEFALRALRDGVADEGEREQMIADLSARRERGELTSDQVAAALNGGDPNTPQPAGFQPAREM